MSPVDASYWGISGYILFWILFFLAVCFFLHRIYRLWKLLRLGKPEKRPDYPGSRFRDMLSEVLLQKCNLRSLTRKDLAGAGHAMMFWGFGLFLISYIIFIGLAAGFGLYSFLEGSLFETVYFSVLDIVGIGVVAAVVWAAVRRYILRPSRLEPSLEAGIILGLVFLLMLLNFATEGLGYATKGTSSSWPPVGTALAGLISNTGATPAVLESAYRVAWWLHYAVILGFLVYIPYSKHLHILTSPFNIWLRSAGPGGVLHTPDLEQEEKIGAGWIFDFSRKDLLDLFSCTECGRCHEVCPARQSGQVLSPRQMVLDLKHQLVKSGTSPGSSSGNLTGGVVPAQAVWDCLTCRACQEVCAVNIDHISKIVELRRDQVMMHSRFPAKIQQLYKNMEENSNPWGKAWVYRSNWAEGLNIPPHDSGIDTIFWAGCLGAYDERTQRVSNSICRLLKTAGIKYTVLGKEEKCCGDAVRRTGNEYLYRQLAETNIRTFHKYNIRRIITGCPHCYNVFKNEYPALGGVFEVVHHTELIASLLQKEAWGPSIGSLAMTVVYHDPCYLGRHNGVFSAPRQVLQNIPEIKLTEKNPCAADSLCCGAGGGRMWMGESGERRISGILLDQVTAIKPDILTTACPYCLTMLDNEAREAGLETSLRVMDVAEVIQEAISAAGGQTGGIGHA